MLETNEKLNRKFQQRKQRYKKEPERNCRTGKYNNQNKKKKTQWMTSTGE